MQKTYLLMALILLLSSSWAYNINVTQNTYNRFWYSCETYSMYPTIKCGDILEFEWLNSSGKYTLKPGDIIWFYFDSSKLKLKESIRFVVHRIIAYGPVKGTYITKGDNNPKPDPKPIGRGAIVLRLAKIYRNA